jgi:hypothetical protein
MKPVLRLTAIFSAAVARTCFSSSIAATCAVILTPSVA